MRTIVTKTSGYCRESWTESDPPSSSSSLGLARELRVLGALDVEALADERREARDARLGELLEAVRDDGADLRGVRGGGGSGRGEGRSEGGRVSAWSRLRPRQVDVDEEIEVLDTCR